MASCHTHAALSGGAAVSAAPTKQTIYPPTEHAEFTEFSGCVYSPTDFTDVHRCWCLLGDALVFARLCRLPEQEVHQPSRRAICFVGAAETAAPPWWLRGYGRMPYPPNPLSVGAFVGKYLSKKYLCASVTSAGAFVGEDVRFV